MHSRFAVRRTEKNLPFVCGGAELVPGGWCSCWSVGFWGMERSRVEHALSKAVVNASLPPSDLALDAIVAGVPVEDTRPTAADVDMAWPADPTSL